MAMEKEGFTLQKNKNPEGKTAKRWQDFGDIEKIVVLYLSVAGSPVPIDNIISLSGLSPVTALNLIEDLKKHRFVCEKKEAGKGVYYPGDIDLQDYTRTNIPKKELVSITKKLISCINQFHMDGEEKIITLGYLYFQAEVNGNNEEGIACIKNAADILNRSRKREKAVVYYDFIIKNFCKKSLHQNRGYGNFHLLI